MKDQHIFRNVTNHDTMTATAVTVTSLRPLPEPEGPSDSR